MKMMKTKNIASIIKDGYNFSDINIIKVYKKNNETDFLYWDILASCNESNTSCLDKIEFNKKIADLYNPRFDIKIQEYESEIVVTYKMSHIKNNEFINVDNEIIIKLFESYIDNFKVTQEEFNIQIKQYILYLKNFSSFNHNHYAHRILKDNIYLTSWLNIKDELSFIENLNLKKFNDFFNNIELYNEYQVSSSSQNITNMIEINEYKTKVTNFKLKKFDDVIINLDSKQSVIKLAYKFDSTFDKHHIQLFNYILGGSSSSLLFMNVREKYQLCYSIYSEIFEKDSLIITVMTRHENEENAIQLINNELNSLLNIKTEILNESSNRLISTIKRYEFNLSVKRNIFIKDFLNDETYDLNAKIEILNSVTPENISKICDSLEYLGKVVIK